MKSLRDAWKALEDFSEKCFFILVLTCGVISHRFFPMKTNIFNNDIYTYKKLKTIIQKNSLYRTYDYKQARKSPIFLEPIKLLSMRSDVIEIIDATTK